MTALTADSLVSEITAELSGLPYAQRVAAFRAYQHLLDKHEDEALKLRYAWPLYARDSQLPPPGDWDTCLHPATGTPASSSQAEASENTRADALVHAVTQLILNRNPLTFW